MTKLGGSFSHRFIDHQPTNQPTKDYLMLVQFRCEMSRKIISVCRSSQRAGLRQLPISQWLMLICENHVKLLNFAVSKLERNIAK